MMTTKQYLRLQQLNAEGKNDAEIARILGVKYDAVSYWRVKAGLPANRRKVKQYAVYLRETGELISMGSARECAEKMGLSSADSFWETRCQTKRGKTNKYNFVDLPDESGET